MPGAELMRKLRRARERAGRTASGGGRPPRHPGRGPERPRRRDGRAEDRGPDGGPPHLVRDLEANVDRLNRLLGFGRSYDVILRRFTIAGVPVAAYVINGFFQSYVNLQVLHDLVALDLPPAGAERSQDEADRQGSGRGSYVRSLLEQRLAYSQVTIVDDFEEAVVQLLAGPMIVLVDGEPCAIVVDTRYYPDREPDEPATEQVVYGPRDGLIENIIDNTALIRRRVRDPRLRFELHRVGRRGKTDVAITYIEGLTSPELVRRVRHRLAEVDIDAVPMSQEALAEFLGNAPWNPFPMVRTTQRPDVAAMNLYDGHVLLVVDTTPVVLIVPATLLQMLQHPEDYYVSPIFGTYLRWVQWVAVVAATLLGPVWLLFATHPGVLAHVPALAFIGSRKPSRVPLALQFVLAEVTVDILRRSILNSTQGLAATFGILGAVVLGDVATKTGIFSPEALVYLVFAAISSFAISNFQLGMTSRMVRLTLIILEWVWGLVGIVVGLVFWLVLAARSESFGVPYLWPLVPFDWRALRSVLIREPMTHPAPRPAILGPRDATRT